MRANSLFPSRIRWLIFALACLASFINYLHRYSWGVVKPYLKHEYGLLDTELGWLDAAFNLTYAMGQVPGGLAGDLLGPRIVVPLAAVLWSLVAAGPAIITTFGSLYLLRLIFGMVQSPIYPNLGKISKSWFPIALRTSMQGAVASFSGRSGGASAALIVGALLMGLLGLEWQEALWVLAGVGILFAGFFWKFFRNEPHQHPLVNEVEIDLIHSGEEVVSARS